MSRDSYAHSSVSSLAPSDSISTRGEKKQRGDSTAYWPPAYNNDQQVVPYRPGPTSSASRSTVARDRSYNARDSHYPPLPSRRSTYTSDAGHPDPPRSSRSQSSTRDQRRNDAYALVPATDRHYPPPSSRQPGTYRSSSRSSRSGDIERSRRDAPVSRRETTIYRSSSRRRSIDYSAADGTARETQVYTSVQGYVVQVNGQVQSITEDEKTDTTKSGAAPHRDVIDALDDATPAQGHQVGIDECRNRVCCASSSTGNGAAEYEDTFLRRNAAKQRADPEDDA
ncbi:hypothetical protein QBC44DRAFT_364749 [Cladorrhinum sp. PSN332]|nr:hypothetical protein QBC44DRAFT_364749 [Cladorrhinum sp. PSN332]